MVEEKAMINGDILQCELRNRFKFENKFYLQHLDIDKEEILVNFLVLLDENREEIMMDFFIKYLVLINNIFTESLPMHIDGRFINKTFLKYYDDLGIILPISLGSDPAYNPLLFSKLGELEEVCGFHPGINLYDSILVKENTILSELKKEITQDKENIHTILQYHFGDYTGVQMLRNFIHDMAWNKTKLDMDQFARDVVDRKMIEELLDSMKLDYTHHQILKRIHSIDPNTKNIFEEIDSIFSEEAEKKYLDCVNLERKLKDIFRNYKKPISLQKKRQSVIVGKSHHGPSCEMNNGDYEYLLNHEYLEAVKEQDGTPKVIAHKGKKYLIFRGTCMRSFIGIRWNPREEYRFSHIHYYFLEIERDKWNETEKIIKKLEKYLHGVVARRFFIDTTIRNDLEPNEKKILKERYKKHYEMLKETMKELEDVNFDLILCDPVPAFGGLILATLAVPCRPNIPLTNEYIQSYLGQIEIETLLSWGDPGTIDAIFSFESDITFRSLRETLCTAYFCGESIAERLRYLESGLAELLPVGHVSENTRPLQLKTLLEGKKSNCEGYVLLLGFLFHLWQDIFPELLDTDIRFYLLPYETLNSVLERVEFKEPHMFITVKTDNGLEMIDPTNRISNDLIRRKERLEQLLQEEGYWRPYRIRGVREGNP